jgi:hypothetical protein
MGALERMTIELLPSGATLAELACAICLCTLADPSPRANELFSQALPLAKHWTLPKGSRLVCERGLSGVDLPGSALRLGNPARIAQWLKKEIPQETADFIARGDEPELLLVASQEKELGLIALRAQPQPGLATDLKPGSKQINPEEYQEEYIWRPV